MDAKSFVLDKLQGNKGIITLSTIEGWIEEFHKEKTKKIINNPIFVKNILSAVKYGQGVDYALDEELNEYPVDTFEPTESAREVMETIEKYIQNGEELK